MVSDRMIVVVVDGTWSCLVIGEPSVASPNISPPVWALLQDVSGVKNGSDFAPDKLSKDAPKDFQNDPNLEIDFVKEHLACGASRSSVFLCCSVALDATASYLEFGDHCHHPKCTCHITLDQLTKIQVDPNDHIYSLDLSSHTQHVLEVLHWLRKHCQYAKPEKCEFYSDSVFASWSTDRIEGVM
ncbi:hypothetical protein DEU56DRAFT_917049 [Suillus clintonianus]|uniref:uncharacterized protein n=1 Tax=Suillus clintonianus TaxID=1904413 RepID=UPI001B861429|nr:uncharacterized protein DEU56DRAFT_917049 [Suillus clintonianus]KAG2124357.1 hypothetical protein DEU56DRAFT_917049 [Suillus clintonianus]